MVARLRSVVCLLALAAPALAQAPEPIAYRLTFPAPEHRWMEVEVTLEGLPPGPLQLRMSRTSPGRYALHEFAKNVFDVRVTDTAGRPLAVDRPSLHQWDVTGHTGSVRATYKVFGDRVDGTYLGIDRTHAHINMPAALLWARGLEQRPVTVRFEVPTGAGWRVATQLLPGPDAFTFTAPNLQYLMDSPSELSAFTLRQFTLDTGAGRAVVRAAVHHEGRESEVDAYMRDIEAIVRETVPVFGAVPAYDGGTYTFIADYLPWASGDGMEHRNSTILTSSGSLAGSRHALLGTVAHEFFHGWNVERIRPRSLEPFDFEDVNVSGELWLAEGFTNYYGPLILHRAGLTDLDEFSRVLAGTIGTATLSPGRRLYTAEEMSRRAPFVDAAAAIDPTNVGNTFISYYTWGAAIGLGLDLTLRDRSDGRLTLDDFMAALWAQFGEPGQGTPGQVTRPYSVDDLKRVLADLAGDVAFADGFFARYIQGREVVDYARLLLRAGLVLRPANPGAAYAGDLHLQATSGGVRLVEPTAVGSPAYDAGLDRDDRIVSIGGRRVTQVEDVTAAIARERPGSSVPIVFSGRGGEVTSTLRLVEDPRQELVRVESTGQRLLDGQRRFRESWLGSRAKDVPPPASR